MKKILNKIRNAYEKHGVVAALYEAEKYNVPYEHCRGCDADMPTIDGQCTICGQDTTTRMTHSEFFERTDFITLGQQKLTLLSILEKCDLHPIQAEDIEGLIHFIDSFQDTAVDNGMSEEEVFG